MFSLFENNDLNNRSLQKLNIPLQFLIIEEKGIRRKVHLKEDIYTLGRASGNSVVFHSREISRRHAHLYRIEEQDSSFFRIIDGDLAGHRSVNGLKVHGESYYSYDLRHGEVIMLSQHVLIQYFDFNALAKTNIDRATLIRDLLSFLVESAESNNASEARNAEHITVTLGSQSREKSKFFEASPLLEDISTPVVVVSPEGVLIYSNSACKAQFPNLPHLRLSHPVLNGIPDAFTNTEGCSLIREIEVGDRKYEQYAVLSLEDGLIRTHVFDITDRKAAEYALQRSQVKEQALINAIPDLMLTVNAEGIICGLKNSDPSMESLFPPECLGHSIAAYLPRDAAQTFMRVLSQVLVSQVSTTIDFASEFLFCEARLIYSGEAEVLAIFRNITERKILEQQLSYEALHDHLTGLYNRSFFLSQVAQAIAIAQQQPNYRFVVLFIDLDRFKVINDSLGHLIGDCLLMAVAQVLRAHSPDGSTVARLGGDEFAVMFAVQSNQEAEQVAGRLHQALSMPIQLRQHELFVNASIGIASSDLNYSRPEAMLRDADMAMYRAKSLGHGRFEHFDQKMHSNLLSQMQLERDFRRALERQQLELHYQPIVCLQTNSLKGFEALVRWRQPSGNLVMPDAFIPLAEETGLITPLGEWILFEASRQLHEWRSLLPEAANLTISINLSGKQFKNPCLFKYVSRILDGCCVPPQQFRFEITESVIMDDTRGSISILSSLRDLGLKLAIDDFGTGYSSLSYLHRFPVQQLKVDRSFVGTIHSETEDSGFVITQTITALAHQLGLEVVAEGIETLQQAFILKRFRCHLGQGYFFSQPEKSHVVQELIRRPQSWLSPCVDRSPLNGQA